SIYRFRGGVSALFGEVARENDTEVKKLLTNYRSQKEVIEFVNRVFIDKIKNYSPQLTREEASGGYVEVLESDELLEATLTQVNRLIELGAALDDIAVLCATNGDGEEIKNLLQSQKIEVVTETTTKLINQRSVQAVLEYLKYLYFKEDIYRHNFFALIGQESQAISPVNINCVALFDIIKGCIEKYQLFSDDFHLIRFLDAVRSYTDIDALIFEYERLDVSAAASDLSGVRVLTVHKSKGLEYKHVIVMDRLKKPPAARGSIIYEYDGITLQNVYLRTSGRDAIDAEYASALAKEKALVLEDSLNALYVAFTRAKENLFIIKKSEQSQFDILELSCERYGELHVQKVEKSLQLKVKKLMYEELYYGTQSDLLSLESQEQEDLSAINFGLAMHYMLEMMPAFSDDAIAHAKDMLLNKYGFMLEAMEVEDILQRVERLVNKKEFLDLIAGGKLYREKALRYKNNLRYLDLLIEKEDGSYIIVDYKSGMNFTQDHHKQVRYYINAVREISQARVEGYLCYLLEESIEIVKV
ncbi:MAG TPA: RecB-like helicase, partial [Sulfurimonas autotrophica]|nr:RecB-like helicase [Sulfurimonas autotrophica]